MMSSVYNTIYILKQIPLFETSTLGQCQRSQLPCHPYHELHVDHRPAVIHTNFYSKKNYHEKANYYWTEPIKMQQENIVGFTKSYYCFELLSFVDGMAGVERSYCQPSSVTNYHDLAMSADIKCRLNYFTGYG